MGCSEENIKCIVKFVMCRNSTCVISSPKDGSQELGICIPLKGAHVTYAKFNKKGHVVNFRAIAWVRHIEETKGPIIETIRALKQNNKKCSRKR